ncbi:hypothetical protein ACE38V_21110 [Cytobacillus sp. Hz8]|uniref:hypothetical protein n=1 Tax=Cytobacillus sp. Hz8 TaxID=3347168 RepID=UPI0035D9293A
MVANKKEANGATSSAASSSVSAVDVFWDGWFNSFKLFQSIQDGVEEKALQTFTNQKEWIQSTSEQFEKAQDESKKWATEWKSNFKEALSKTPKPISTPDYAEWTEKVEEIGDKAQALFFSPGKSSLDLLSKTHAQVEKTIKDAIEQQQKNRVEVLTALDSYVDQIKQIQNSFLSKVTGTFQ